MLRRRWVMQYSSRFNSNNSSSSRTNNNSCNLNCSCSSCLTIRRLHHNLFNNSSSSNGYAASLAPAMAVMLPSGTDCSNNQLRPVFQLEEVTVCVNSTRPPLSRPPPPIRPTRWWPLQAVEQPSLWRLTETLLFNNNRTATTTSLRHIPLKRIRQVRKDNPPAAHKKIKTSASRWPQSFLSFPSSSSSLFITIFLHSTNRFLPPFFFFHLLLLFCFTSHGFNITNIKLV